MEVVGDLYALLGVSPAASQDEIRNVYRAVASRFHPDVNRSPAASLIFTQISTAYDVLNDPTARADYDQKRGGQEGDSYLHLSALLSRKVFPRLNEPQLVYALVALEPPPDMVVGEGVTPLNLCLVIDRSTSMKGPRLDQVKAATTHIIEGLHDEDIVSVVSFSDRADVVIPASRVTDRRTMRATVSTMRASGATAMYEGLRDGMREVSRNFHPHYINHLVLITDGHTYGDADSCLELADEARAKGVAISAMGIGEDWNDEFLDQLASRTGGSSAYIASHRAVTAFVEDRIRSLGTAYAERVQLVIAPAPGVKLDSIFKVSPDPLPLDVDPQPIPLGLLDVGAPTSLIAQFSILVQDDTGPEFHLGRVLADADILLGKHNKEQAVVDLKATVTDNPSQSRPPTQLLQALSKVTLYRLQEHARIAVEQGDIEGATRSLRLLSTRLLEHGEEELALEASREADRVSATRKISDEGHKNLKYGTRALIQQ